MRTVLSVDPFGAPDPATGLLATLIRVERSPFAVPAAAIGQPLALTAAGQPAWGAPDAVKQRGIVVRDALRAHAGICQVLDSLAMAGPGQVQPLFVKLSQGDSEQITWEALCDSNGKFLALDKRWPVGRIADPMSSSQRPAPVLRLPFKIMAIISAFGIKGQQKEWQFFENAVRQARAGGLDVQLRLLVADQATRAAIDARIAAGDNWIEVSHVESTGARVVADIAAWDPNVVHFFCHGIVDTTDQYVELATAADLVNPAATCGSVTISAQQLADMSTELTNPWLLALNCCSSGVPVEELQSIAYRAVSAGFPASVAMLEPVDANDAHEFTRAFYLSFIQELRRVANDLQNQLTTPFEWAQILFGARTAIVGLHANDAANYREWALPALYVRGVDPVKIERPAPVSNQDAADFKLKARTAAEWAQSQYDLSDASRRAAIALALADVPKEFWPDPDGSFPSRP